MEKKIIWYNQTKKIYLVVLLISHILYIYFGHLSILTQNQKNMQGCNYLYDVMLKDFEHFPEKKICKIVNMSKISNFTGMLNISIMLLIFVFFYLWQMVKFCGF